MAIGAGTRPTRPILNGSSFIRLLKNKFLFIYNIFECCSNMQWMWCHCIFPRFLPFSLHQINVIALYFYDCYVCFKFEDSFEVKTIESNRNIRIFNMKTKQQAMVCVCRIESYCRHTVHMHCGPAATGGSSNIGCRTFLLFVREK